MKGSESVSAAVPESVMVAVKRTLANVEDVQTHLNKFLSLSDPEVLAGMQPLQRAQSLLLLAKVTTTLFTGKLSLFCVCVCVRVCICSFACKFDSA